MRQIATLPERDARTLADYLLTRQIQTQLMPEGESWAVWVCNEDQVAAARGELDAFLKDPANARYAGVARAAQELRRREEQEDEAYENRQADLAQRMAQGQGLGRPFVTLTLVLASVAVSVAAGTAFILEGLTPKDLDNVVLQTVLIQSLDTRETGLKEVERGQVWRLITPIFLHFGPIHLLFNLLMLRDIGGAIEARRGSLRMVLLVLILGVASNLGQYFFAPEARAPDGTSLGHNPLFGGMSGVLYGLFGYLWMKSRYAPEVGLFIHPSTVTFMIGWFFLCLSGVVAHVANVAHAVGLVLGIVIGAAPHFLGRLRGGGEE